MANTAGQCHPLIDWYGRHRSLTDAEGRRLKRLNAVLPIEDLLLFRTLASLAISMGLFVMALANTASQWHALFDYSDGYGQHRRPSGTLYLTVLKALANNAGPVARSILLF